MPGVALDVSLFRRINIFSTGNHENRKYMKKAKTTAV